MGSSPVPSTRSTPESDSWTRREGPYGRGRATTDTGSGTAEIADVAVPQLAHSGGTAGVGDVGGGGRSRRLHCSELDAGIGSDRTNREDAMVNYVMRRLCVVVAGGA